MNSILLIAFILFSLGILFIQNIYILLGILLFSLILLILYKVKLTSIKGIIILVSFIFITNLLLMNIYESMIVSIRLIIMYLLINILIKKIGILEIAHTISLIFHSKDLYLIISIALTFIPLLKKELSDIKKSLIAKNFNWSFFNIIKNGKILVITFFHNLFMKVDILEKVILSKGY